VKPWAKRSVLGRARFATLVLLLLSACSDDSPSILEPAGPAAERVETLWWPMFWIATGVFLVVAAMLVKTALNGRARQDSGIDKREVSWGEPFVAIAGVFIPVLILGGVYLFSLRQMDALAGDSEGSETAIEVVGRDWWWEVRYPNGAVTANEIHIPVGEPVEVELTTADVIHSFWVPRLQVKTDQIPGEVNRTWLEADRPGVYRGQCAEFCGLQHANMVFYVIAEPRADYEEWLANEAAPAESTGAEGEQIFLESSCAGCHAVRGTDAEANLGPDLTHVAARTTLAGVMDNTRENLLEFVRNPQDIKPGVTMPPTELSEDELEAVVDYLGGLD
jgi:cytochrome c oxidase subunit II